jgi:hypothetical protein
MKAFITGCDKNTEWTLPWFLKNYRKYCDVPIIFYDFGVTEKTLKWCEENFDRVVPKDRLDIPELDNSIKWFLKPFALLHAINALESAVWIDTDCQVIKDPSSIFNLLLENKINIVKDRPWTSRRGEVWYNTGVVGVTGKYISAIHRWSQVCIELKNGYTINKIPIGDQDALLKCLKDNPLFALYINELPNEYNWLRIQFIDGQDSKDKMIIHWTGPKGKEEIKRQLNG